MDDRTRMTGEWLAYCASCTVPEIANVFRRARIPFHQVTGVLHGDPHVWQEIEGWVDAALVAHTMAHNRLGVMGRYPPSDAELEAVHFARHPHVMVAPLAHPLASRQHMAWDDLQDSDVIFRERGSATRIFFEQILQAKHMKFRKSMEMSTNEAVKQAVMNGMGISFLSAHACQTEISAGLMAVLDLVDMPKYIDWCLIHRRDSTLSGVNLAFKQFVLKEGATYSECVLKL